MIKYLQEEFCQLEPKQEKGAKIHGNIKWELEDEK